KYYDDVRTRDAKTTDYFRMFLLPGVLHCGGGPGPDNADWVTALDGWVEKGTAPDRVVAQKRGQDGGVSRSRPLCPHPQHAIFKGSGSTDDAANFTCAARGTLGVYETRVERRVGAALVAAAILSVNERMCPPL